MLPSSSCDERHTVCVSFDMDMGCLWAHTRLMTNTAKPAERCQRCGCDLRVRREGASFVLTTPAVHRRELCVDSTNENGE